MIFTYIQYYLIHLSMQSSCIQILTPDRSITFSIQVHVQQ